MNDTFRVDMQQQCQEKGNPWLDNGHTWVLPIRCSAAVQTVYDAVYVTATGVAGRWW